VSEVRGAVRSWRGEVALNCLLAVRREPEDLIAASVQWAEAIMMVLSATGEMEQRQSPSSIIQALCGLGSDSIGGFSGRSQRFC
jgi:hypothetical protein